MKRLMVIPMVALSLLVASCVQEPDARPEGCGDGALAKTALSCIAPEYDFWKQEPPARYSYTFTRSCFCPQDLVGPHLVTVDEGVVTAVSRVTIEGDTVSIAAHLQTYSLGNLWNEVQNNLGGANGHTFARYDSTYGFPDSVYVDRVVMAIDDEYGMTVTDFYPLIRAD